MKTHKRRKSSRKHGRRMATHGGGARKKSKGSGHRGGKGMAGSGKRADHKKTLITARFGHNYFGKQGVTSRGTKRDKRKRINIGRIETGLEKYGKKTSRGYEIDLKDFKILGTGEIKNKLIIRAKEASKSAIEKVAKAGGEIILSAPLGAHPKVASPQNTESKGKKSVKKEIAEK